jgi:hypothetical protein
MKFQIRRDQYGMWTAWEVMGTDIVGPCASLDMLFHLMTQRHLTFSMEIVYP